MSVSNGAPPGLNLNRLEEILSNAAFDRREFFSQLFDSRRDIDEECGYPTGETLDPFKLKRLFDRDSIGGRVVELLPKECWRRMPMYMEDEDDKVQTDWEAAVLELNDSLQSEKSWYRGEACNYLNRVMFEADVMAGISGYAGILIGYDDVKTQNDLALPVDTSTPRKVLYMQAYPETLCQIQRLDPDMSTRHFGMPEMYTVALNDPSVPSAAIGMSLATVQVHHSRIVHIASDELGTSRVRRPSRMAGVLNNILAAQKPYHASAEGYWKSAFFSIVFKTMAQLAGRTKLNVEKLKRTMDDWENTLQRWFAVENMDVAPLVPSIVDPTPYAALHIEAICIRKDVPLSIFKGTDRADIRKKEDAAMWNGRCGGRNERYTTPAVVCPVLDRLIQHKALPEPESYTVKWPDLNESSEAEQLDSATKRMTMVQQYTTANGQMVVPLMDFYTRFLGYTDEDAKRAVADALKEAADAPPVPAGPAVGAPSRSFPNRPAA